MRKFVVITMLLSIAGGLFAQIELTPLQAKREKTCQHIYQQIIQVMGDRRQAPRLVFRPNHEELKLNVAHFNPKNNTINLGEGIYDIAVSMGEDSLDALAYALGHELAHFYKDHNWGMAFGAANGDMEIAKTIYSLDITSDRRATMEAEADYFGSVCAYLAGYEVFRVADKFIEAYYKLGVPDEVFGYPSKDDRVKTIKQAHYKILNKIPLLDAARHMAAEGRHELAARCYVEVAASFPNKSLLNNAGVNFGLAATKLMKDSVKFHYPFTMDLYNIERVGMTKGMRGIYAKPDAMLKSALDKLNASLEFDPHYVPALLNKALVQDLRGEHEQAWATIITAEKHKSKSMELLGHIFVAKGIISHHKKEKGMCKRYFDQAMEMKNSYGMENMNVLKTGEPYKKKQIAVKESKMEESINGLTPSLSEVLKEEAETTEIRAMGPGVPRIKVYTSADVKYEAIMITEYGPERKELAYISTPSNYKGKSAGGLEVGDVVESMLTSYGKPDLKLSNLGQDVYVYRSPAVIFRTRNNKILGWTLYQN